MLTGDRPTGRLHLGHYAGSLANRIRLHRRYESYFIIADLHMLTTKNSPAEIAETGRHATEMVLDSLAAGLDPAHSVFYLQSAVPEVAELSLLLSSLVTVPRLQRIPSLKEMGQLISPVLPRRPVLDYRRSDGILAAASAQQRCCLSRRVGHHRSSDSMTSAALGISGAGLPVGRAGSSMVSIARVRPRQVRTCRQDAAMASPVRPVSRPDAGRSSRWRPSARSRAAVAVPTPRTPGMLSERSPTRAERSHH
jgi:tryptophanyl-tRNA synthetase